MEKEIRCRCENDGFPIQNSKFENTDQNKLQYTMINSRKINYEESRGDPINMKRDTYIRKK